MSLVTCRTSSWPVKLERNPCALKMLTCTMLQFFSACRNIEVWRRSSIMRTMVDIVLDVYTRTATSYICTFAHFTADYLSNTTLRDIDGSEVLSYSFVELHQTNQTNKSTPIDQLGQMWSELSIHVSIAHKGKRTSPKRTMSNLRSIF